jgi:putative two-component system response regulator
MDEKMHSACRLGTGHETILMVDDNPTNLQVLSATLKDQGYRLLVARDGAAALAIVRKTAPDLVLLDIMMPGMDGFEVLRRLKADSERRDTPVIFLSALGQTEDKIRGLEAGAVDYITKPFQPGEVIARVRTHLTLQCLQRELDARNRELEDLNANLEQKVAERSRELLQSREAIIFAMAKLTEARDDDTGKHLERICRYVEILARQMARSDATITEEWIQAVVLTAALHDIGKVGIPDGVLLKPGRLTPAEREIMERHPAIGGDTLLEIRDQLGSSGPYLARAIEITLGHHEKWDGSGYPFGVQGEAIALSARLVAVADVYDALISERVYKPGMPHNEACRFIQEKAGGHFDPRVVEAFLARQAEIEAVAREMRATDPDLTVSDPIRR